MDATLLERTHALLEQADQPLREIADAAGVGYWWLTKLKQRRFENPGVNDVEKVFRYLSERASRVTAA